MIVAQGILALIVVAAIGLPVVIVFDKWKKEMEADEKGGEKK